LPEATAQARALVHALADAVPGVADLLALLNAHLARDMTAGRYMTFFVAVVWPIEAPPRCSRASGTHSSSGPATMRSRTT